MLIFIIGTDTHFGLRSNALAAAFSKIFHRFCTLLIKYRPFSILRGKRMKFTAMHMSHRSILNTAHLDSARSPEHQWKFLKIAFFFFSQWKEYIKDPCNLQLKFETQHSLASVLRLLSSTTPLLAFHLGVEKLACALLLVDLRLQISWWDALCLETKTTRTTKLALKS